MKIFPGSRARKILENSEKYYATTTQSSRIVVSNREGPLVIDVDGNKFYDFHCDASVNNLGGNNLEIRQKIIEQLNTGNFFSEHHNAPNEKTVKLAEILSQKSPVIKPSKVFFSNSGAEANEAARKLCVGYRVRTGQKNRKTAIYFRNGFAGRTKGVLSGTSSKAETQRDPFWDHCDQINSLYVPYPTIYNSEGVIKIFDNIMLENVDRLLVELSCQGEGGIIPSYKKTISYIIEKAQKAGVICIVDAIQCGMGRDGPLFGCDTFPYLFNDVSSKIVPDILTLGKALGGGLPIGVTIFRSNLDFEKGQHANTFGGGPLVSSVALEVFSQIENMISSGLIKKLENSLIKNLFDVQNIYRDLILESPRGRGAMWALEFVSKEIRDQVIYLAEEIVLTEGIGLRFLGAGRKAIRFMPPLNISQEELNNAFHILKKTLLNVKV